MDPLSLLIGFIIGLIAATMAIEFGMRKPIESTFKSTARLTYMWSLSEIKNPRLVAEYLDEMMIPKNAKVVFKECSDTKVLEDVSARKNEDIRANFVLGDERALLILGPVREGQMGVWIIDPFILKKLESEFERLWSKGEEL
ncbi:hypothetical protein B6U70_01560 [Euryarchaeota archaeon ex4484_162]|nr:hypothetical protein [Thermoplasmata archaeon]OYT57969.1 MAG: hypothetical protein B6U70_01560 [Euryarchaeota archaeon ex4484_162]